MEIMLHLTLVWICVYLAKIAAVKTKMTPVLYFLNSLKKNWDIAFFGAINPFAVAYSFTNFFWNIKIRKEVPR